MESPIVIILQMIWLVIENTIGTVLALFGHFYSLTQSLGFVSLMGGAGGFFLSVVVLALAVFFLGKFVLKAGKGIMVLILLVVLLVWIMALGMMAA